MQSRFICLRVDAGFAHPPLFTSFCCRLSRLGQLGSVMGDILFMSGWLIKPSILHVNNILLDRCLFCLKSYLFPVSPDSNGKTATVKTFLFGCISTESSRSDMVTILGVKHSGEAVFIICFASQQLLRLPALNLSVSLTS